MPKNWTTDEVRKLIQMWNDGVPTVDICKALDVTKGQVHGMARRQPECELRAPARKNTIGRAKPKIDPSPKKMPEPKPRSHKKRDINSVFYFYPNRNAKKKAIHISRDLSPFQTCQYIAGEASVDDGCKCGKPALKGYSWCEEHISLIFVNPIAFEDEAHIPEEEPDDAHEAFPL